MNKLNLVVTCVLLMILGTGCQGVFDTIPKETVMVKPIHRTNAANEAKYEGVLSQDTVKTLSLNAVNKYFDKKLTLNEIQLEMQIIDQNKFKALISEAEYGLIPIVEPAPALEVKRAEVPKRKLNDQTELASYSDGLFYTTLTKMNDPNEIYDIVLNARDGDVVKAARAGTLRDLSSTSEEDNEKVIALATTFIQEKGSYPLSELSLNEDMIRWGSVVELYYMSKDGDKLMYTVSVDLRRNEVVGFSKDVMALLSYYSRL
ncbi:hypothetical protein [Paenibacillus arenosi]|uniref:Lipoprotein n=1 Tax=Paenibacillus arenosi TaxID=2774142 RepID=A0ABR9AW36_9BACL|nr:hypothetical protein [Paenibacillus arenosi]MBD8497903.1 hypothetical protein [Paenibacillus arenosi]